MTGDVKRVSTGTFQFRSKDVDQSSWRTLLTMDQNVIAWLDGLKLSEKLDGFSLPYSSTSAPIRPSRPYRYSFSAPVLLLNESNPKFLNDS
jgi:hypothetical protein